TLANGTTVDLTKSGPWASSMASVAAVSSEGLVVAFAPGETDISVTYQGVIGKSHLTVGAAAILTISGRIQDQTSFEGIPNVNIQIIDSAGLHSTKTDASGSYTFSGVTAGGITLTASADGYRPLVWETAANDVYSLSALLVRLP